MGYKEKIWNQFTIAVAFIFLFLIIFILITFHKNIIAWFGRLFSGFGRGHKINLEKGLDLSSANVTCPLCGRRNNLPVEIFDHVYLENVSSLKNPKKESIVLNNQDTAKSISLIDLGKPEELV